MQSRVFPFSDASSSDAPQLSVRHTRERGCSVVTLTGELDLFTREMVAQALERAAVSGRTVVVDLSELAFVDASGLGTFVAARNRATAAGADLVLRHPSSAVSRIIDVAGLDSLIATNGKSRVAS